MRSFPALLVIAAILGTLACGSAASSTSEQPSASVPSDFGPICEQPQATCNDGEAPPNVVGDYVGQGKTLVTSNELWRVGDMNMFKVTVATQDNGQAAGSFDIDTFHLDIGQAYIRGSAQKFSIYGTDSAVQDGCSAEAQGILSGTAAGTDSSQISGQLVLLFTKNIVGQGCTQSQIDDYPGTGATFSYSATRAP